MLYSEKPRGFAAAHPCKTLTVDGAVFRYTLSGKATGRTLVFLNGGMNTLEMWMDYVDPLAEKRRVLLFDYPRELKTNQAQAAGMHALFERLGIQKPIFVGGQRRGHPYPRWTRANTVVRGGNRAQLRFPH